MAKKSRQGIGYNPQKIHRFRPSKGVTITRTDESLDSFKEELSKVVLKWLSGKLGVDRKIHTLKQLLLPQMDQQVPILQVTHKT